MISCALAIWLPGAVSLRQSGTLCGGFAPSSALCLRSCHQGGSCAWWVDPAPAALTRIIHCTVHSSILAALPVGLVATVRRPTYSFVEWTAPPSPFSGNYQLTYGPLGGPTDIRPSWWDDGHYHSQLYFIQRHQTDALRKLQSGCPSKQRPCCRVSSYLEWGVCHFAWSTHNPSWRRGPTLVVPQVGNRDGGMVEITIASPPFQRQDILRYIHIC